MLPLLKGSIIFLQCDLKVIEMQGEIEFGFYIKPCFQR